MTVNLWAIVNYGYLDNYVRTNRVRRWRVLY